MGDKPPKCFVPDCNNSVGVLFPKVLEVRKKWLRALKLEHLQPNPKSFVCLEHFEENGQPGIAENVTKNERRSAGHSDQQNASKVPTHDFDGNEDECITIYSRYEKMCRLCMVRSSNVTTSVFNKLDEKHTIAQAIAICLHPLQVLPNDGLSNRICTKCIKSLREFLNFHQTCIATDAKQREFIQVERNYHIDDNYADSEHSEEYLHEERLSDYEDDKENQEDKSNGQIAERTTSNPANSFIKPKYDKEDEELLKVLEGNDEVVLEKINKAKPIRFSKSSASESNDELYYDSATDPLEFHKKDDGEYTENIIIEVINDEPALSLVDTSKLPITIKRVESASPKRKGIKRKSSSSDRSPATMLKCENQAIVLPSGISVARKETFSSPLGKFGFELIKYVFNSQYLLAGGYLYEFGLVKGNIRRLHCIVGKCPGTASHPRLSRNEYSNVIEANTAHNHEMPDNVQRKRQMFYHILYGKMRRDKDFNFKTLYQHFCKVDPSLVEILPLRSVVKEICKQGPTPAPPLLDTFAQFYAFIERDDFRKVHFTENRSQFYQDKFETPDGAKAVVFGSQEVIGRYSSSKLMYVDASFLVESHDFPYQLVTVLVWVDRSYYPILYAFINVKSQELYKKIFGFLYHNLAPKLRPHEIVTDYEANLYYSLGETYVESSIGGSMFYFTQNIYKKICSLKLARELELNANFRSIYNMLLMLPLLPVNTIRDALHNVQVQAKELDLESLTDELFVHVRDEWISKVTPELFCVHRLENRINENIVAPFKKLRDLIMLGRNKVAKNQSINSSVIFTIEKLIDLERFLRDTYSAPSKKSSFTKDLSSSQKKSILKAWNYIENFPMININQFFLKVLGYIKCMENQLWIWGFYRYGGTSQDVLIDASNFSIISEETHQEVELLDEDLFQVEQHDGDEEEESQGDIVEEYYIDDEGAIRKVESRYAEVVDSAGQSSEREAGIVMHAVIDDNGKFVLEEGAGHAYK